VGIEHKTKNQHQQLVSNNFNIKTGIAQIVIFLLPNLDHYPMASFIPSLNGAASLATSMYTYKYREFVSPRSREGFIGVRVARGVPARICLLSLAVIAFWICLFMAFVLNAQLIINGEPEPLAPHLLAFARTSNATEWRNLVMQWLMTLEEFERITVSGNDRVEAYAVLGLKEGASMSEVRKRFRTLAMELHPDHHHGEMEKEKAEKRFANVQQAYHKLVERYGRRADDEL
jgi:hypothetical protein